MREACGVTVIPFQLRPLLGSDPAKVSAEGLQRLIGEQESSVSDWKEKFDGSPDSRRELARDVASFGNAQGGLLVIGLAPFSAVGEVLFFPWWGDVEVVEDGSLGGGEAVESDAVVGVGESESLERGEGVSAGG
jgi:hypothetical protein